MANSDKDIPVLTSVIQQGDSSMHRHFDAHQFSENKSISSDTVVENASLYENLSDQDIPSITLDVQEKPDLAVQDFTEAMRQNNKQENPLSSTEIKSTIDEIIADVMPRIELELKQSLYKKFGV